MPDLVSCDPDPSGEGACTPRLDFAVVVVLMGLTVTLGVAAVVALMFVFDISLGGGIGGPTGG